MNWSKIAVAALFAFSWALDAQGSGLRIEAGIAGGFSDMSSRDLFVPLSNTRK